jgi:ribonuclease PH
MTDKGEFVEIQGTAEGKPFSRATIDDLLTMAGKGIKQLFKVQKSVLAGLD